MTGMQVRRMASPVGEITLASDGEALCCVHLAGQRHGEPPREAPQADTPLLLAAQAWLERYFALERPDAAELPLRPAGSAFQQTVWSLLREIPYGQVVTYGELADRVARRLGRPRMSAQAVGGAVSRNPLAIVIPCHRVVGARGWIGGYDGGVERKLVLLQLEAGAWPLHPT